MLSEPWHVWGEAIQRLDGSWEATVRQGAYCICVVGGTDADDATRNAFLVSASHEMFNALQETKLAPFNSSDKLKAIINAALEKANP